MQHRPVQHPLFFSRRERTGIFTILAIILLILFLPYLYLFTSYEDAVKEPPGEEFLAALADSMLLEENVRSYSDNDAGITKHKRIDEVSAPPLFYFDPNTATDSDWQKLGLRAGTIQGIRRYLSKGGRFRKPESIYRIWGIDSSLASRLLPYVTIRYLPSNRDVDRAGLVKHQPSSIEINTADSAQWESLPGIGPSLARRIVQFRGRLGGFYSVEQVSETFGLPDSVYQKIKPRLVLRSKQWQKISLNQAAADQLKNHPYIRYRLANAIDAFRKQHGNFGSVSDIRKIMMVTDSIFVKLEPYLSVD